MKSFNKRIKGAVLAASGLLSVVATVAAGVKWH